MRTIVRPIQEQRVFEHTNHLRMNTEELMKWYMVHSAKVYCTPSSQMGKSVQANLSRGLQSLTGYRQVGAVGEVASAVVTVADTASDTVGVGDSALSEMSMFISLSGSVWCATGRCFGAQSFKWSMWRFQNRPFPRLLSMWVVPVTGWFLLEPSLDQSRSSSPSLTESLCSSSWSRCSFCQDCCRLTLCSMSGYRRSHKDSKQFTGWSTCYWMWCDAVCQQKFSNQCCRVSPSPSWPSSLLWKYGQTFLPPHLMLGGMEMSWCAGCHSLEQIQQSQQKQIEGHCLTRSVLKCHGLQIRRCRNTLIVTSVVVWDISITSAHLDCASTTTR